MPYLRVRATTAFVDLKMTAGLGEDEDKGLDRRVLHTHGC